MTDKPRWVQNATEIITYDLAYAIMPNGDVVTSDGLPRGSFDEQAWIEQFGRPISFRKPTPEEEKQMSASRDALRASWAQFVEGME